MNAKRSRSCGDTDVLGTLLMLAMIIVLVVITSS